MRAIGKVILVGAGPGDPELITVKGLKAIQQADAILYDALSGESLLDEAKHDAEIVYVGKRCGKHSLKQPDINRLLADMAAKHKTVVRLKGGDPFVFGRGHEELSYLKERRIEVELIPGISSVTSLPLLQEVPLTKRGISESFWVLTGTTKDHKLSKDIKTAVQTDATLVILMGLRKIGEISQLLIDSGKAELPIMIVKNGSRKDQTVIIGHANNIEDRLNALYSDGPGVIIIGEVVALHEEFIHQYVLETWA